MLTTMNAKLNRKERKAQQLLQHYAVCERLAHYLGMPARRIDGKKISVALWKADRLGQQRAERMCSDSSYTEAQQDADKATAMFLVKKALGTLPPGFFVNSDPRGYALKIDNENPQGLALIESVGLSTDMGGYGILSPDIDGN